MLLDRPSSVVKFLNDRPSNRLTPPMVAIHRWPRASFWMSKTLLLTSPLVVV
jgi:hypothetical protein